MKRRARGSVRAATASSASSLHQMPTFYLDSNFALAVELPPTPVDTPMDNCVDGDNAEPGLMGTTNLNEPKLLERFDELAEQGVLGYAAPAKRISDSDCLFPYELLLCPALLSKPEIQVPIFFSTASVSNASGSVSEFDINTPLSPTPAPGLMDDEEEEEVPKFGGGSDIDYVPELVIAQMNGNDPVGNSGSGWGGGEHGEPGDIMAWASSVGGGRNMNNTHWLVFNKFNVFRPQYLVLTINSHLRQTSPLDITDFRVAWKLLNPPLIPTDPSSSGSQSTSAYTTRPAAPPSISTPFSAFSPFSFSSFDPDYEDPDAAPPPRRWTMIYNCGPASGCSREHKHFQLFDREDIGGLTDYIAGFGMEIDRFRLFRDTYRTACAIDEKHPPNTGGESGRRLREKKTQDLTVPFRFWYHQFSDEEKQAAEAAVAMGMDAMAMPQKIFDVYDGMLAKCREALGLGTEEAVGEEVPHNVVLTDEEIVVIPRRRAEWKGISANAVGMMGVLWMSREEKIETWQREGVRKVLRELGVPW